MLSLKFKYQLLLWKKYVDRGRGLTSYFNELFLLFGFWSITAKKSTLYLSLIFFGYAIMCFLIGWAYFYFQWEIADKEIDNQYNFFQKEIRRKMRIKGKI